jgi:hypothetical protein
VLKRIDRSCVAAYCVAADLYRQATIMVNKSSLLVKGRREGEVKLEKAAPSGDTVVIAGKRLGGFSRVRTTNAAGPWYEGTITELPLGEMPASDLNGNRSDTDTLPIVVTRASDGWVLFIDSNGNGSLGDERPVHVISSPERSLPGAPGRRRQTSPLPPTSATTAESRHSISISTPAHTDRTSRASRRRMTCTG